MEASAGSSLSLSALAIDPLDPSRVYGGGNGVYRTTDSGATWAPSNAGFTNLDITAVAAVPKTSIAYASGGTGLFKSTDSGGSWSSVNAALRAETLVVDPLTPSTLYATVLSGLGVIRSTDSGASWLKFGPPDVVLGSLTIDPATPSTLYGTLSGGILKSTDAGDTWVVISTQSVGAIVVDPITRSTLYSAAGSSGVFKSTDSGISWAKVNVDPISPRELAIDPVVPSTLYALDILPGNGVFRSTDSGSTWTPANTGLLGPIYVLLGHPSAQSTLYAAGQAGVFRSTDSGASWVMVRGHGAGGPEFYRALALDPTGGDTLYAGYRNGSVWQATAPKPVSYRYFTLAPCRALDTRDGGSVHPIAAGQTSPVGFRKCGVPRGVAAAVAANVTVVDPAVSGDLKVYPASRMGSLGATIPFTVGRTRASSGVFPLDFYGATYLQNDAAAPVNVLVDVTGYFR